MIIESSRLKEFSLFVEIKEAEIQPMLACVGGRRLDCKKNEVIDLAGFVGLVVSGSVHILKTDIWGTETIIARVTKGQLVGESYLEDDNSDIFYRSKDEATLLLMNFKKVMNTCQKSCVFHHRLIMNVVRLMAKKNTLLLEKIDIITKKTLREKILAYLSMEAQHQGTAYLELPLNRQELAEYLFANRSALSKELGLMKKDGLIDFEGNVFHILEVDNIS